MQSLSSPTSWDLGPRQYLFEDNSALNKFNQNGTKLNRIISGLAGTELDDDGAGLNVLGCQADILETNCNELDVCNNSYSFHTVSLLLYNTVRRRDWSQWVGIISSLSSHSDRVAGQIRFHQLVRTAA